jgi:hypothetical protein
VCLILDGLLDGLLESRAESLQEDWLGKSEQNLVLRLCELNIEVLDINLKVLSAFFSNFNLPEMPRTFGGQIF